MNKNIKKLFTIAIILLVSTPIIVSAVYGSGTSLPGTTGTCSRPPCYSSTHKGNAGVVVTLLRYDYNKRNDSDEGITEICHYSFKLDSSVPRIMSGNFMKWVENRNKASILSTSKKKMNGVVIGIFSQSKENDWENFIRDYINDKYASYRGGYAESAENVIKFFATKGSCKEKGISAYSLNGKSLPKKIAQPPSLSLNGTAEENLAILAEHGYSSVDEYNTALTNYENNYAKPYNEWALEVEKYYISVEPMVGLKTSINGSYNVKTVRRHCESNVGTTFPDFLKSVFDAYNDKDKNICPKVNYSDSNLNTSHDFRCIGPSMERALVGTTDDNPLKLVDYKKVKDEKYTCARNSNDPPKKTSHINRNSNQAVGIAYYWIGQFLSSTPECTGICCTDDCTEQDNCTSPNHCDLDKYTDENGEFNSKDAEESYFACAENYCETKYIQDYINKLKNELLEEDKTTEEIDEAIKKLVVEDVKRECLQESCEYNATPHNCLPFVNPTDPDDKADPYLPSNNKDNPNHNRKNQIATGKSSTCGSITGSRLTCEQPPSFPSITNSAMPIDQRRYYSVECGEKTTFGFKDISGMDPLSGALLDYDVKLDGEKDCTIFFDNVSWKMDYAAISLQKINSSGNLVPDTLGQAKRDAMIDLIRAYKNAFDPNNISKIKSLFKEYDYNADRINASVKFNEIVNDEKHVSDTFTLTPAEDSKGNTNTITNGGQSLKVPVVENGKIKEYLIVNEYLTSSSRKETYQMPGQCVKEDGTVYTVESGKKCNDTTEPHHGYFTHFKSIANSHKYSYSNQAIAIATIGETSKDTNLYISSTDTCQYKKDYNNYNCTITLESPTMVSDIYDTDIKLKLSTNIPSTEIIDREIRIVGSPWQSYTDFFEVKKPTNCSIPKHVIEGRITTTDNQTVTCPFEANFVGSCQCELESVTGYKNVYELKNGSGSGSVPNPQSYYYNVNGGDKIKLTPYEDIEGENPDLKGKYLIFTENYGAVFKLFGIIEGANDIGLCDLGCDTCRPTCTMTCLPTDDTCIENYCNKFWQIDTDGYENPESCQESCSIGSCLRDNSSRDPSKAREYCKNGGWMNDGSYETEAECRAKCGRPECTALYEADEVLEIKNYCRRYWQDDDAGYQSYDDCINYCPRANSCENITALTKQGVIEQCSAGDNYKKWRFQTAENCSNECCIRLGICKTCNPPDCPNKLDYTYRPINAKNPFPNSFVDPNARGLSAINQRDIGNNWFAKEKYITESERGLDIIAGKNGEYAVPPRYEITLDSTTIRAIRTDTILYNQMQAEPNGNIYIDYIRTATALKQPKYESNFIHSDVSNSRGGGGFKQYFTYIDGEKIK